MDKSVDLIGETRRIGIEKARELLVEKISNYCSHSRKVYEERTIGCSESPSVEQTCSETPSLSEMLKRLLIQTLPPGGNISVLF